MILFQYHSFTEDHQYLDSSLLSAKSWQILENRLSQHPDLNEDQTVKYNRKGIFGKDTEAEKLNCSVFIQRIKETEKEYLCFVVGNSASKAPKEKEFGSTARDVKATQILHYRAGKLEIAAHPPLIIKICHDEYTSNKKLKEIIESEWSWLSTLAQHTGKTSQYHYFTVAKKHYLVQPYRGQCSWEKIIQSIETQKKFCGFTNEQLYKIMHDLVTQWQEIIDIGGCHRDIALENITFKERLDGTLSAHIIDFGAMKALGKPFEPFGRTLYIPPEYISISGLRYTAQMDGYALGNFFVLLYASEYLVKDNSDWREIEPLLRTASSIPHCKQSLRRMHDGLYSYYHTTFLSNVKPDANNPESTAPIVDMIKGLVDRNPTKRPTPKKCLELIEKAQQQLKSDKQSSCRIKSLTLV